MIFASSKYTGLECEMYSKSDNIVYNLWYNRWTYQITFWITS